MVNIAGAFDSKGFAVSLLNASNTGFGSKGRELLGFSPLSVTLSEIGGRRISFWEGAFRECVSGGSKAASAEESEAFFGVLPIGPDKK